MKKKNPFYIIAATVVVVVILITTLFFSGGSIKSWRHSKGETLAVSQEVTGDVSITRKGLNYTLKEGIILREEDQILAGHGAGAVVKGSNRFTFTAAVEADSTLVITTLREDQIVLSVSEGIVFFDGISGDPLTIRTASVELLPAAGSVLSVDTQSGAQSVNVYSGTATVCFQDETKTLAAGDHLTAVQDDRGKTMLSYRAADVVELSESLILRLRSYGGLCFTPQELSDELVLRRNEARSVGQPVSEFVPEDSTLLCTIEIRCDTILDHLSQLTPEELAAVPEDGVILPATQVGFNDGESAFEIMRRLCDDRGIPLSYSYTLVFGGYYIEGINGLHVHEAEASSGWLYRVNGWFPNYSCGRYKVNDGDIISFVFSCDGWGKDVGRDKW